MKYSKEFNALIDSTNEDYIGHGNPNAKILFIGQEGASDPEASKEEDGRNDYLRSIKGNREDWSRNIQEGIGYDNLPECCTPDTLKNYNPLYPYKGQKFQVRYDIRKKNEPKKKETRGKRGTARTWFNYQKLINRIFELFIPERKPLTKDDDIDFHCLSFHSDMSAYVSPKHNHENKDVAYKSVLSREALLSNNFFQNFPIVIAAVGHFPRDVYKTLSNTQSYFEEVFGVKLFETVKEGKSWINLNSDFSGKPKLLIHCPQFSANISNAFIEQIAKRIVDFAKEYNINLLPEE